MEDRRSLIRHGVALFLIGLVTGLAQPQFANIRMGLAAHLEGVMNGIFLIAIGAIWNEVRLTPRGRAIAYWTLLLGTYGNWCVTTVAAVLGTAALTPIAGGQGASPAKEMFVTAGFVTIGLAMICAASLLLWGLRGKEKPT